MSKSPIDIMLDKVAWKAVRRPPVYESDLPYATHEGVLQIGPLELRCYQLSDGQRVIDEASVIKFLKYLAGDES